MVINSKVEDLHLKIADLKRQIRLTDSQEQVQLLEEEIEKLREQIRSINRKEPNVVQVKDASTVGDKMEARLAGKVLSSTYSRGRVIL
jgi:peptidoglycan hydrolase CwlO-like protein